MRYAAILSALALAACDQPGLNERQQDEVVDLASDAAQDTLDQSARIAELEARIEELESRQAY